MQHLRNGSEIQSPIDLVSIPDTQGLPNPALINTLLHLGVLHLPPATATCELAATCCTNRAIFQAWKNEQAEQADT